MFFNVQDMTTTLNYTAIICYNLFCANYVLTTFYFFVLTLDTEVRVTQQHNLDEFVYITPNTFDHNEMLSTLQRLMLNDRIKEQNFASRVSLLYTINFVLTA